jgi:hypothetical protein
MCIIKTLYHIINASNISSYIKLLRHLYCCCNRYDVSFKSIGQKEDKELNVLSNQLIDAINNSMSTKIDEIKSQRCMCKQDI